MSLSGTEAQKLSARIARCDEADLSWVFMSQHAFDVGDIGLQDSAHLEAQQSLNGHHAICSKHGMFTAWSTLMTVNVP